MNINYVICSYGGIYNRRFEDGKEYRKNILKKHLEMLNNVENNITQISIMKPKISNNHIPIKDYYNFESLNIENIKDKIKIIECENQGISYGQFLTCINNDYIEKKLYDYYIFNEDDYIPLIDNFDSLFIDEYNKNEMNYLCLGINVKDNINTTRLWKSEHISVPDFAIGLIDKNTINYLYENSTYDNLMKILLDIKKEPIHFHQISFGYLLHKCNIKIRDVKEKYLSLFYENCDKNFYLVNLDINNRRIERDYKENKYKNPLFIPIDFLYINFNHNNKLLEKFIIEKDYEIFIEKCEKFHKIALN